MKNTQKKQRFYNGFCRDAADESVVWGCQILWNYLEKIEGSFHFLFSICHSLFFDDRLHFLVKMVSFKSTLARRRWRYPKLNKATSLPWMIYNFYGHHTQFAILECRTLIFSRSALFARKKNSLRFLSFDKCFDNFSS